MLAPDCDRSATVPGNVVCFYNDSALRTESRLDRRSYAENQGNGDVLYRAYDGGADRPKRRSEESGRTGAGSDPMQVLTGKRVFISYRESDADPGAPNLTYNEFYALMKSWRKYELVQGPADADLVFEIRYVSGLSDSQLCLSIVDPKTHFVLWPFIQHVQSSSRETARRKNFDQAMTDLVDDVRKVTTP